MYIAYVLKRNPCVLLRHAGNTIVNLAMSCTVLATHIQTTYKHVYTYKQQTINTYKHTNMYTRQLPIFNNTAKYVTRFAKTRHNDAFLEIQIFASMSSIYLNLCSVAVPMLYSKYFSSYKARQQEKQHISFIRISTTIIITRI